MNALVKRRIGSFERVTAESAQHVGGVNQRFRRQQRQRAHAQHGLRAIDQRDRLFCLQHEGLDLRTLQRLATRKPYALFIDALALTNQSQRQMRQRRKVSAGTNASLRRDVRRGPAIQHLANPVDDNRAHARVTFGKRIGAQKHHGARLGR